MASIYLLHRQYILQVWMGMNWYRCEILHAIFTSLPVREGNIAWNIACHFYQSTCQRRKVKKKVEYSRTNDWMKKIRKSVIMSVESEWIRNNWENTPSKVLGVWYTTLVFLTWHVQGHASAVKTLFPSRPYWTKFLPEPHSWYSAFVKPVLVAATM